MDKVSNKQRTLISFWRAVLEMGFIIFLFYSNLLMGEFTNSGLGNSKGLIWAVQDIFTLTNFTLAIVSSLFGYLVFDFLRNRK